MTISCIRKKHKPPARALAVLGIVACAAVCQAAEAPFFVTYTHQLEEPGNLELDLKNVTGKPDAGNRFLGTSLEFEYGAKGWWTTEFYLDGQATANNGALMPGFRWENRFRVLPREHWINPVLYVEYENINGADKSLLEIVGHDGVADLTAPNAEARSEKQHEIEMKLILGSYYKDWTIAENFVAEKNLGHDPFEFGYAAGISRPLALAARPDRCNFCAENFQAGVEIYGGLGTHQDLGFHDTAHYVAPTFAWTLANGTMFRVEPSFGLTGTSVGFLLRFGVAYEIDGFGRSVARLFRNPGGQQ